MEIPKEKILELLREHGHHDKVDQAEQELPDQVDTEKHGDLLSKYTGLDTQEIVGKLGGLDGIGKKLGL